MPTDYYSAESHFNKDELLELLNEIDTERQSDRNKRDDQIDEDFTYQTHPDPNNQFR